MKIHEERDALLEKVERLNAEKRELEQKLDDARTGGAVLGGSAEQREEKALAERERELLKEQ